jgi:hypothetical protein
MSEASDSPFDGFNDPSIDSKRPSAARVYDYMLGGFHNFAADRALAEEIKRLEPDVVHSARSIRAFLARAVRFLRSQGVDQFLDIGSGIPTVGNVHEIAQDGDPGVRVVYVDLDPVAVMHSRSLLADNPTAIVVYGDLCEPAGIVSDPEVRRLLDFDRPIALILSAVLHFVTDEHNPIGLLARLRGALPPDSWIVLSHLTDTGNDATRARSGERLYEAANEPLRFRSRSQIAALLDGWDLVEPGLTWTSRWRSAPDDPAAEISPERSWCLAAVGQRRSASAQDR